MKKDCLSTFGASLRKEARASYFAVLLYRQTQRLAASSLEQLRLLLISNRHLAIGN
jgi:hypothetical protein